MIFLKINPKITYPPTIKSQNTEYRVMETPGGYSIVSSVSKIENIPLSLKQ